MHDKKECRNKFCHKLNVPHNVATCEHKSDRDKKRDVNYNHIAILILNLFCHMALHLILFTLSSQPLSFWFRLQTR